MKLYKFVALLAALAFTSNTLAATVVLDITFDGFPEDIGFALYDSASAPSAADVIADPLLLVDGIAYDVGASSPIGFGDGFALPGDFDGVTPGTYTFEWTVGLGTFNFIVIDAFGDGLCCDSGLGEFSLSVDGVTVFGGSGFSSFAYADFTSTTPIPLPAGLLLFGSAMAAFIGFGKRRS